jgi:SOS-response transcriptional repressor LexA
MGDNAKDEEMLARLDFGKQIKALRKYLGETQKKFGERFGTSQQVVANWERGLNWPDHQKTVDTIRALIAKPPTKTIPKPLLTSWQEPYATTPNFTQAPEDRQAPRPVPVVSWVAAGGWEYAADPHPPGNADEWVDSSWARSPNSFALVTHGDSMSPEFCEGDIIVVDPDVPPHNGSFVIAKNGAEATFKQLIVDGDRRYLKPLNPRYPIIDGVGFRVVGVVVEKKKRYS